MPAQAAGGTLGPPVTVPGARAADPAAPTREVEAKPMPEGKGSAETAPAAEANGPAAPEPAGAPAFDARQAVEDPMVKQTIELFGAKVVDVQPRRG